MRKGLRAWLAGFANINPSLMTTSALCSLAASPYLSVGMAEITSLTAAMTAQSGTEAVMLVCFAYVQLDMHHACTQNSSKG